MKTTSFTQAAIFVYFTGAHVSGIWVLGKWLTNQTKVSFVDWLYFSHVKKAVREADWTYRFLHMWNIANIEFSFQRLQYKILAIYIIK